MNAQEVVREIKQLEFTAKYLWPVIRRGVSRHISKRCDNCIASEQYVPLTDGICPVCRENADCNEIATSNNGTQEMTNELDGIFRKHESSGTRSYDALVLFSGGKDSTYLFDRLTKSYPKLKILALTVDNHFMSPVALNNIRDIVARLDLDHVMYRPPFRISQKMFSHAFTHLNELGCSGTVDQFEGDYIFDTGRNFAAQHGIPLVIGGISPVQVEQNVGISHFETPREMELGKREVVAGIKLSDVFTPSEMSYWWDGAAYPAETIPRVIFPFYAWGYDEQKIRAEVVDLGLMSGRNNSPLLTNSQLVPLMAMLDIAKLGYSSFEPEFTRLVREGRAEKSYWRNIFEIAEYSARTGRFIKKSVDGILERLALTRSELGLLA